MNIWVLVWILVIVALMFVVLFNYYTSRNDSFERSWSIPDVTILIHTFDGYVRMWDPMMYFWTKHYIKPNTHTFPIHFANENRNYRLMDGFEMKHTGYGGWGKRLRIALENITTDYVLYLQEDFWLHDTLSQEKLEEAVNKAKTDNIDVLQLFHGCQHPRNKTNTNIHHPSIWKKSFLLETLKDTYSPSQHLMRTSILQHIKPKITCLPEFDFPYKEVNRRGRLTTEGGNMLSRESIPLVIEPEEVLKPKVGYL